MSTPGPIPLADPEIEVPEVRLNAQFVAVRNKLGMYSGVDVEHLNQKKPTGGHLIAGLIARRSVNILVGDSGIGKSPMAYQMAIAVAAGLPFLGLPVNSGTGERSKVMVIDYENNLPDV